MSIWQASVSSALGPGVYGVNAKPAASLPVEGTDVTCLCEQFPWGPTGVVYDPTDIADRILTFYPPGMSRLGAGALALQAKGWPDEREVRIFAATGTAAASCTISTAVPLALIHITLKYVGLAGNSAVATTSPASDGNALHFNVNVVVTGVTGTTTDVCPNVNVSGTLADYLGADLAASWRLIGSITKTNAGSGPVMGSTTFTGGLEPAPAMADYVGTQGLGDKGLALTEGEDDISHIAFGNCPFVTTGANLGMQQHVISLGRRMGWISGVAGQTAAAVQTDVALFRSDQIGYIDAQMVQTADQDGSLQTIPTAPLAMSVAAQLPPSSHISWRDSSVAGMMTSVTALEQSRGAQAFTLWKAGVTVLIKKRRGGFAFYMDPTSNAPVNPSQPSIADTRMGQYIITSAEDGFQSNVNGPNVPTTQLPMRAALTVFMNELVFNASKDPSHNPYVKSYSLDPDGPANPQGNLDAGDYAIPVNAKTDSGMIRIFVPLQYGPNVSP
jgi:hypothetical protein